LKLKPLSEAFCAPYFSQKTKKTYKTKTMKSYTMKWHNFFLSLLAVGFLSSSEWRKFFSSVEISNFQALNNFLAMHINSKT
jgi:hypothetical protein